MNKDDVKNEENKDNSESINKLYSNDNNSEDYNSKTGYGASNKLKDDPENKKYIKEMQDIADKNEFKNNVVFIGFGIVIVSIIIFSILMNTSFMKPKTDVVVNKPVTKSSDTTPVAADATKPIIAPTNIYNYLNVETNRTSLLKKAITLNHGSKKGINVYLLSEILRSNTYAIPAETTTVKQLMAALISMDWKKNRDVSQLKKGDICFTTDMPDKVGTPSHAYIFMGWVKEGKTDYANICDGQIEEFGNILHKRNLSIDTTDKDKFSFFIRK
ncbi:hypothetical protein [Clostridium estertheticum]|uniref:hypothetical protein n=1 Tax=Clostridium estertheticum TaxID=238834 RepID=UPI001C7CF3EF|nr:hypothetical protein [Clostridium estertheticum]MBX4266960.1 hypothetical protein [Clostridium estertheticum]MBX4271409.1 hypothetical protein [Clostridium estertheticum]WLC78808.1 hypothetical protein KTC98_16655 [Clostridium estertheticum]WLC89830.1 hypothetical protein KTC95_06445 [Clostridium estertheticum]